MKLQKPDMKKRKFTLLILFLLCAAQTVFSGCILDPLPEGVLLYEIWTVNGKPINTYKKEGIPEYLDYPTHIWLENYVPTYDYHGRVKFVRLGWLPILENPFPPDDEPPHPTGISIDVKGKLEIISGKAEVEFIHLLFDRMDRDIIEGVLAISGGDIGYFPFIAIRTTHVD